LSIALIGAGRLAAHLGLALQAIGRGPLMIGARDPARAEPLAQALGARVVDPSAALQADWVFVCVRDDAIASLSASLPWSGQLALHASGATELDALASATRRAGFHPLQLFADPLPAPEAARAAFAGIHIGIEAGDEFALLAQLARDLGAQPLRLRAGQRARYHAAANMAASGLFAPLQRAVELWSGALDLPSDQAWAALQPLAAGALRAASSQGLAAALSGPLARGDAGVLARHLLALDGDAAEPLYRELMRTLLVLAEQRLPPDRLQALRNLLAGDHSPR
jgi:predicted short-subunit dehydrogenase-like oxidoreductase (DUF2520 family)